MANRGRRCCCCMDVTFFNGDLSALVLRAHPGTTVPERISSQPISTFGNDLRNKLIFGIVTASGPPILQRIFVTNDLKMSGFRQISSVQGVPSPPEIVLGTACDWSGKRVFYISKELTSPRDTYQIRSVNYDGTNDHKVINEPGQVYPFPGPPGTNTAAVTFNPWSLQYNIQQDKLYYVRRWGESDLLGPTVFHFDLRSVKSDGTGQTTVMNLDNLFDITLNNNANVQLTTFISFVRNELVVGLVETLFSGATQQDNYIKRKNISTGAITTLLHSVDDFVHPFERFLHPYYCIKDGKIYFYTNPFLPSSSRRAGMSRINWDGTGYEQVISLFDPSGAGRFSYSPGSSGVMRPSCGFEITGDAYNGPG